MQGSRIQGLPNARCRPAFPTLTNACSLGLSLPPLAPAVATRYCAECPVATAMDMNATPLPRCTACTGDTVSPGGVQATAVCTACTGGKVPNADFSACVTPGARAAACRMHVRVLASRQQCKLYEFVRASLVQLHAVLVQQHLMKPSLCCLIAHHLFREHVMTAPQPN